LNPKTKANAFASSGRFRLIETMIHPTFKKAFTFRVYLEFKKKYAGSKWIKKLKHEKKVDRTKSHI